MKHEFKVGDYFVFTNRQVRGIICGKIISVIERAVARGASPYFFEYEYIAGDDFENYRFQKNSNMYSDSIVCKNRDEMEDVLMVMEI